MAQIYHDLQRDRVTAMRRGGRSIDHIAPASARLEFLSDMLLRGSKGIFEEYDFCRKIKLHEVDWEPGENVEADPNPAAVDNLAEFITAIVFVARLSNEEYEVISMRLNDYSFAEIGLARGHSRQYADKVFNRAVDKIGSSPLGVLNFSIDGIF